jgi:hypothetical protein
MSAALSRLFGAATASVGEIVASLTESERARLAVFCYGRAHLNARGLAIAVTVSLEHLITAAQSAIAGRTIFNQARDRAVLEKPPGRRTPISLATAASYRGASEPAESHA